MLDGDCELVCGVCWCWTVNAFSCPPLTLLWIYTFNQYTMKPVVRVSISTQGVSPHGFVDLCWFGVLGEPFLTSSFFKFFFTCFLFTCSFFHFSGLPGPISSISLEFKHRFIYNRPVGFTTLRAVAIVALSSLQDSFAFQRIIFFGAIFGGWG